MEFLGQHILSVSQFDREAIEKLMSVADRMKPYANKQTLSNVLNGAILGNMFFEPSTRTRTSFGCAFNRLGGYVRETVGIENSALAKGESLSDTAKVMSGYSDIIVMRHPLDGSVAEFAKASRVPVINAGDGSNEHPSQALLDLYTMSKELHRFDQTIDGMKIAMVGDLKYGRTVHSLSKLLKLFNNVSFIFVSPKQLAMPVSIIEELIELGHNVTETDDLESGLANVDIVYQTRIQEERFPTKEEANKFRGAFRINRYSYSQFCHPSTVIMHPLPRDSRADANELDIDMDEHPNMAVFRQADNGVLVRMALFALILGVDEKLSDFEGPVNWVVPR
ncbi:MAG: aspartate carbamoyltransferase catalytic subunit [Enterobacterales bacterium]|jgi:aspartate carbamoyltransferase catalytic subunit